MEHWLGGSYARAGRKKPSSGPGVAANSTRLRFRESESATFCFMPTVMRKRYTRRAADWRYTRTNPLLFGSSASRSSQMVNPKKHSLDLRRQLLLLTVAQGFSVCWSGHTPTQIGAAMHFGFSRN